MATIERAEQLYKVATYLRAVGNDISALMFLTDSHKEFVRVVAPTLSEMYVVKGGVAQEPTYGRRVRKLALDLEDTIREICGKEEIELITRDIFENPALTLILGIKDDLRKYTERAVVSQPSQ